MRHIGIALFLSWVALSAKEPDLGLLLHVKHNSLLDFAIDNREQLCVPYGIYTLEMLKHQNPHARCQNAVDAFYKHHPDLYTFGASYLYPQQQYHLEVKHLGCVVYAMGSKSYAKMLLEVGMAVVLKNFNDKRFAQDYRRAQAKARKQQQGLWSDAELKTCMMQ